MGIKGLTQFIRQKVPSAVSIKHLSDFKNQRMAIDTAIYIFKFKCTAGSEWLSSFHILCTFFKSQSIQPLFVFDSQAPPEKLIEQTRRRVLLTERKKSTAYLKQALNVYKHTGEIEPQLLAVASKIKHPPSVLSPSSLVHLETRMPQLLGSLEKILTDREKQQISITPDDIYRLKQLLVHMDINYVQALAEAEATCSYLLKQNDVDLILTDDSDVLAYGQSYCCKLSSNGACIFIDYQKILDELQIHHEEFLDFCILLGTDYNERVKGFGPVKALKTIQQSAHLENIAEYHSIDFNQIRRLFAYQPFPLSEKIVNTSQITPDESQHVFFFKNHIRTTY